MRYLQILAICIILLTKTGANAEEKPLTPSMLRTELRIAKSLNLKDTETLDIITRDGGVAQLIIKKRDPKSNQAIKETNATIDKDFPHSRKRSFHNNRLSVNYFQPNIIRFNQFNSTNSKMGLPWNSKANLNRLISLPKPVTVYSDNINIKSDRDNKRARSLVEIDTDGIPIIHGTRVPDDESDKKVWRNARIINGELIPYEDGYKPPAAIHVGQAIHEYAGQRYPTHSTTSFEVPKHGLLKDVFQLNKSPVSDSDRHYKRTSVDNRQHYFKLMEAIQGVNMQESKKDYASKRSYRAVGEAKSPQIEKRMLHYQGNTYYSNSHLNNQPKVAHVNFNEGVRTPILEYAHPELGVEVVRPKDGAYQDHLIEETTNLEENLQPKQSDNTRNSHPNYYTNNLNSIDYYKGDYTKYPAAAHYIRRNDEQPFWTRIAESIKHNVQSGFNKVEKFTKPIVEATHQITHNLGLSMESKMIQKRIGDTVPIGGSIILPALGLVAGGAALGLGAAAMGKFLDPAEMKSAGRDIPNSAAFLVDESNAASSESEPKRTKRSLQVYNENQITEFQFDSHRNTAYPEMLHLRLETNCSKKLLCEVLLSQGVDEIVSIQRKFNSLIVSKSPELSGSVLHHLQEVLNRAKGRNCSTFICAQSVF